MNTATTTSVQTHNQRVAASSGSFRSNGNAKHQRKASQQDKIIAPGIDPRASKKYKHTFAVHSYDRASLFSQDAKSSPSSLGFRNLMGLVIVISNARLMVENLKKYGILVTFSGGNIREEDRTWFWILYALTPCHLFIAYLIESAAARFAEAHVAKAKKEERGQGHKINAETRQKANSIFSTWGMIAMCHAFNATFMLAFATFVVYYLIHNP